MTRTTRLKTKIWRLELDIPMRNEGLFLSPNTLHTFDMCQYVIEESEDAKRDQHAASGDDWLYRFYSAYEQCQADHHDRQADVVEPEMHFACGRLPGCGEQIIDNTRQSQGSPAQKINMCMDGSVIIAVGY